MTFKFPAGTTIDDIIQPERATTWVAGQRNKYPDPVTFPYTLNGFDLVLMFDRKDDDGSWADTSHMGEESFKEPGGDFIFDREHSMLYLQPTYLKMSRRMAKGRIIDARVREGDTFTYNKKKYVLLVDLDEVIGEYDNFERGWGDPIIEVRAAQVLFENCYTSSEVSRQRDSARYIGGFQHTLKDVGFEYEVRDPATMEPTGEKRKLTLMEVAGYCKQDAEMLEHFFDNDWGYVTISCEVYLNGKEIGSAYFQAEAGWYPRDYDYDAHQLETAEEAAHSALVDATKWLESLQPRLSGLAEAVANANRAMNATKGN